MVNWLGMLMHSFEQKHAAKLFAVLHGNLYSMLGTKRPRAEPEYFHHELSHANRAEHGCA